MNSKGIKILSTPERLPEHCRARACDSNIDTTTASSGTATRRTAPTTIGMLALATDVAERVTAGWTARRSLAFALAG
jgi:hypothetical protein